MSSVKNIVITGASGFLGRHLLRRLDGDERFRVYALSSRAEELKETLGESAVSCLDKDALREERGRALLPGAMVVNCAYPRTAAGAGVADGLRYIQGVLEASVENGAAGIVNISSQSVYSQQRSGAATEETPVCPESVYALGKFAVELLLESVCKGSATRFTNLRLASLIGPGFEQRIVNRFVKQALETGTLSVKRNRQRFGFFDVEDAVSGICCVLASQEELWRPVYNLGGRGGYSLEEIAAAVRDTVKREKGAEVEIRLTDGDESGSTEICADAFRSAFGFSQEILLEASIHRMVLYADSCLTR